MLILFTFLLFATSAFSQQPNQEEKVSEMFDIQKMPSFPGGQEALDKFLADNLYYTPAAYEQNLQGTVALSFVVEKDGSLTNFKVLKDIGGGLGEIAASVIRSSPKWVPGEANGNLVRVKFTLPVRYRLGITKVKNEPIPSQKDKASPPPKSPVESEPVNPANSEEKVYNTFDIQKMPGFPGGETALQKFLTDSLYYTPQALEENIQGTAAINFVVRTDGSLTDIKILKDPGRGLGKAAVEVVKTSPKWIPGEANGQPVSVTYTLPVRFRINDNVRVKYPAVGDKPAYIEVVDFKVYETTEVEQLPAFPGGEKAMNMFIKDNLNYTKEGKEQAKQYAPMYEFTVEKDGSIKNIRVLKDPGYGMGSEGVRLLKAMPKWSPGMKNGKPVRVNYRFELKS